MTLALACILAAAALAALGGLFGARPPRPAPPAGRRAFEARLRDRGPAGLAVPRPHAHAPRRLGELLAVR